ncbi:hypothetical protein BN1723_001013 [Verticillium longisporum]|uniref:Amidohydrolase-related domain-containing protein n=1 Tax=Verticillium longisporum TaxID=100787 RepID=A0A0G4NCY5_VERLO|nr:hypothetical protein BN1723_001013 [Verticillium longisporum]
MYVWSQHQKAGGQNGLDNTTEDEAHNPLSITISDTMPIALSPTRSQSGITRFTNCRLVRGDELVTEDLWLVPKQVINDLVRQTSNPELYQTVLPYLGPSNSRHHENGAESLGAHCEGPFLNSSKKGIHNKNVLQVAETFEDIEACYGSFNLTPAGDAPLPIKKITIAPEQGQMMKFIPELTKRGIICSIGHTEATYEEASSAVAAGVTMITHLFNAMRPLHHRNPGVFGVLGASQSLERPYFGIIADGIHLHPTTVNIAFNTHPDGFILVTDAMHMMGLPDGAYQWTNGDAESRIIKVGPTLLLEGTDTIAGSSITLIECVNNFLKWSGTTIPKALKSVTSTPAAMLEVQDTKGSLESGADADLVVFSEEKQDGATQLVIDEVWKFGTLVYRRGGLGDPVSPM